jgi:hypothetical protein
VRMPRSLVAFFAALFAAGFLIPILRAHLEQWAQTHGRDLSVLEPAVPTLDRLADITQTTAFMFITGFFVGGALLIWIDYALRRRRQKMGLILASIGLATFVIGVGIYLFPEPSRLQAAAIVPPKIPPAPPPPKEPERDPLAWSRTPILGWSRDSDGTLIARTIGFAGKNIGREDVQLEAIYVVSAVTNERMELKVQVGDDAAIAASETNPIPPDAFLQLSTAVLNYGSGIAEAEFLRDWGTLNFIVEYDGKKHVMTFERPTFDALFDAHRARPEAPHVTRKQDRLMSVAPAATPPPPPTTDERPPDTLRPTIGTDTRPISPAPAPANADENAESAGAEK